MSEQKFDPMTGQPINPDPVSQQPGGVQQPQQPVNQPNYGNPQQPGQPYGMQQPGQPYGAQQPGQPYGAQQPGQPYGAQQPGQPYGMPQGNPYGYNPAPNGETPSDKNKKKALIAVGIGAVLVLILVVVGIIWGVKSSGKKASDENGGTKLEASSKDKDNKDKDAKDKDSKDEDATTDNSSDEDALDLGNGLKLQRIEEPDPDDFLDDDSSAEEEVKVNPSAELAEDDPKNLFTIQIGDEFYHTSCSVAYYMERGWTLEDKSTEDKTLGYMESEYLYLYYNGNSRKYLSVDVTNLDVNAQAIKDCYVTQLSVSDYESENLGMDFKLHDGDLVISKSTREDVIKVLGEPNDAYDNILSYFKYDSGEPYTFGPELTCYFNDDDVLRMVAFENQEEPAGFAATEVSDEVPEYLAKYKAPTSLGDDPFSGNFLLDGKVYNLPTPFSELVDNGWKYAGDPEYIAGAGQEYVVQFHKDDMTLTGRACNPSDKATHIKYTMLVSVSAQSGNIAPNNIEFPCGLSPSMTTAEVVSFLETNNITNYTYHEDLSYGIPFDQSGSDESKRNNRYTVYLDGDNVGWIDVQSYGWLKN